MKKNVFFRVDGGEDVGLGHLIRSISLSKSLKNRLPDSEIIFIGKESTYMAQKLEEEDIPFIALDNGRDSEDFISLAKKQKPSLIFIDTNYSYKREEIACLNRISKVVLFNNLYEGALEAYCTIIPNGHRREEELSPYRELSRFYHGIDYALINDRVLSATRCASDSQKGEIGITTGGSDPENVLMRLLHILQSHLLCNKKIVAYYGENYLHRSDLFRFMQGYERGNISAVPYKVEELLASEIIISTFGVSTYELLYSGKPIISIGHSLFNTEAARTLNKKYDCFVDWGYIGDIDSAECINSILELLNSPERIAYYAERGPKLIDGKGLERITQILVDILNDGE